MTQLVPNRLLMDFEFPLHYRSAPPKFDGTLSAWRDEDRLPELCRLDDLEPFADVWACWNETGLFVACRVSNKHLPLRCDPKVFWKSDNLRLCTDLRDARQNKRATRFCQHLFFMPTGGGKNGREPVGASTKIQRARDDAPLYCSANLAASGAYASPPHLEVRASVLPGGYVMQAHVPRDCLQGFDPAEHPRIGFYYMLEDYDHGQQYLTVGDELNWYVDPSTWATAVLTPP